LKGASDENNHRPPLQERKAISKRRREAGRKGLRGTVSGIRTTQVGVPAHIDHWVLGYYVQAQTDFNSHVSIGEVNA